MYIGPQRFFDIAINIYDIVQNSGRGNFMNPEQFTKVLPTQFYIIKLIKLQVD